MEKWTSVKRIDSTEGNVSKFIFTSADSVAETVLYKHPTYRDRTVVCFSVMSGCPMGCRFCGTGEFFIRNLTANEIVEQVTHVLSTTGLEAHEFKKIQLMSMSMGEPLLNKNGLTDAFRTLYALYPNAALLISTSAPAVDYQWIRDLSVEIPTIGLQFSVHESTDEARDKLIPFKAKLTLAQIAAEGEKWYEATGRQPFFNYCAHDNNDKVEDADRLEALFNPAIWQSTVSVICEQDESVAAANERQRKLATDFMELLMLRGYSTRCFDPAGQDDIGGGCGQLFHVQNWVKKHPDNVRSSCGAGLPKVHMPRVIKIIQE